MPDIHSYTPEWLTRPSPGFDFFLQGDTAPGTNGTSRRLAHRGTEVFYAVGSEIRWADLTLLEATFDGEDGLGKGWRSLKAPVAAPIQQISVSPDGNLLAVTTAHTCHICILPAASHLRSGDDTTLKLRAFQIGPTAHVLEQAPIVSALWHPLSIPGLQTLVTVTHNACVRMFELDTNNRHSFDEPGVALDLVKLANATSGASDFSANKFGTSRGFSPDDVEMEVAAACFGGQGFDDEYGWACMTLWVAMVEGDVYALCPFLPSRFRLPQSTLPSLTTAVVAQTKLLAADSQASDSERLTAQQQSIWLADLDEQDPIVVSGRHEFDRVETYTRPERPDTVKLQGPFQLSADVSIATVTDIVAIAPVVDDAELYDEDEDSECQHRGLSLGVLCLATETGRVHICLNLDSVQAQWLPTKRSRAFALEDDIVPTDLLLFETINLPPADHVTFSLSPLQRYELLATTSKGVYILDFWPWTQALEEELAGDGTSGTGFRLNMLLESTSAVTAAIKLPAGENAVRSTAAVAVLDAGLGYFVLTATSSGPHAVTLSIPVESAQPYAPDMLTLPLPEPRESYHPASVFFDSSELDKVMSVKRSQPVGKALLGKPVQSTPEALHTLTDAHRILSQETHRLGLAAADLFRRCERMCAELADQVSKVDEISQKVTMLTEVEATEGEEGDEDLTVNARIDQRIMKITSDADNMNERFERIRRKMLRLGGEDLSRKEKAFVDEVRALDELTKDDVLSAPVDSMSLVKLPDHEDTDSMSASTSAKGPLAQRLQHASEVSETLIEQVKTISEKQNPVADARRATTNEYKKQKLERVMQLLERESALIEAVTERLGRLGGL